MKTSATLLSILVLISAFYSIYGWPETMYLNGYRTDPGRSGLCGTGRRQSPINIQNETVIESTKYISFKNYNTFLLSGQVSSNAYTVQFLVNQSEPVKLNLNVNHNPPDYQLRNVHFHWGCTEHHFNSISYALEVHLVHFKQFTAVSDGANDNEADFGISVVAVLFELSNTENEALNTVLDMIRVGSTHRGLDKKTVTYRDLLPKKLEHVYQYGGSLTTVPCNESVLWNVIGSRNYISFRQIYDPNIISHLERVQSKRFEVKKWSQAGQSYPSLQWVTDKDVAHNCRAVQPLNNRIVYRVGSMGFVESSSVQVHRAYESLYLSIMLIAVLILRPSLC